MVNTPLNGRPEEGFAGAGSSVGDEVATLQEVASTRFNRPPEPDYDLTPAEHLEIRNSNVPLTIGLLFSVIAAFVVFFASLVGGTAGGDPVLPSFWRGLSALAVFTTLSFVVSWFMPAPSERRLQLQKLDQADPFGDFGGELSPLPEEPAPTAEEAKGAHVDLTLADELDEYDEDELDEEVLATGPIHDGASAVPRGGTGNGV